MFLDEHSTMKREIRKKNSGRFRFSQLWISFLFCMLIIPSLSCQSVKQESEQDTTAPPAATVSEPQPISISTENLYLSRQNAITRAVATVSPAVVGINVKQVQRFQRREPLSLFFPEFYRNRMSEREVESLGSGFFISADGFIVTNEHVVNNAREILITTTDGQHLNAKLVGSDRATDIALLKVDGDGFPYIPFGKSDDLMVGEWVIAFGNPFGLVALNDQPTVTVGVISAVDRDWGRTQEGALYLDMIQTDAAINHGNSGGPLVNALGQAIGMNTFIYTGNQHESGSIGIGFAIPIDRIQNIVSEIRENGGVDRNIWLGIDQVVSLNQRIIRALNLSINYGAIITAMEKSSPADRGGLAEYDVITGLNGQSVTSREDFIQKLRNTDLKVGTELQFTVNRDGNEKNITLKLEQNPRMR